MKISMDKISKRHVKSLMTKTLSLNITLTKIVHSLYSDFQFPSY